MKNKKMFEEEVEELIEENKLDATWVEQVLENDLKKSSKKKYILVATLFFLLIMMSILFICTPTIQLKGKENQTLPYLKTYKEKGYTASLFGKDQTKKIKVTGKVNPQKLGTYILTYTVSNGVLTKQIKRKVTVADLEKPVLTLTGSALVELCPGTTYKEEGYIAKDNHSGDLTKNVKALSEKDHILYTVEDTSKNKAKKERKLVYKDEKSPEIQLNGSPTMYITEGTPYIEPGYGAYDTCDGDVTKNVTVEGTEAITGLGTYTITYRVKDKVGNEGLVQRMVIVRSKSVPEGGVIYLTFDDGPRAGTTTQILDILKEEGIKASFFVTSSGPDSLIKREFREGHTVALHTSSHNYASVYASAAAYFSDLQAVQNRVVSITGTRSMFLRFPGGSSNVVSKRYTPGIMTYLTKEVVKRGYRYYDWNVDSEDAGACAGNASASCVSTYVTSHLSKRRVNMVLMHDTKSYTAAALRDIIRYGKNNGYMFKAITYDTPMVTHGLNN